MLCRMPAVNLPDDLLAELEEMEDPESQTIDGTEVPGVASYVSSDGSVRVDIFIGLKLDAFKLYRNISAVRPSVKMKFTPEPDLICPDFVVFDPQNSTSITIQVDSVFFTFCCYCIVSACSLFLLCRQLPPFASRIMSIMVEPHYQQR